MKREIYWFRLNVKVFKVAVSSICHFWISRNSYKNKLKILNYKNARIYRSSLSLFNTLFCLPPEGKTPAKVGIQEKLKNPNRINIFSKSLQYKISKTLFFGLILIFFFPVKAPAKANIAWIKPPQTSFLDFRAHIEALDSPHITYGDYQLLQHRKAAHSLKLINHIQKAQELYLSGTIPSAKQAFQNITQMAHAADWEEEDRRIMLYAFLRRAQLEEQPDIKRAFLLSAVQFSRKSITPEKADYTLFPPPLTEEFNTLLKNQVFFTVLWKEIFPEHEIILINGKRVSVRTSIEIPEGVYRITALSSSHTPWSQAISLSRLIARPVHTKTLTTGTCQTLKIASRWKRPSTQLLSPECPAPIKFVGTTFPYKNVTSSIKRNTLQPDFSEKAAASQKQKIPKWFWIAGGVATASLLIYFNGFQTQKSPPPVFHY